MKKLFTSLMVLLAAITMNAQEGWTEGQDVSAEIGWSDYDGTTNEGAWQGTGAAFDHNEWEIFQGSDVDRYQLVYVPAGVYVFKCQGYYRDGSNDKAAENYYAGKSSKNAILYVETGSMVENEEGEENFVAAKTWSSPLCSQWINNCTEKLFSSDDWQADASYTYEDVVYYAPNSMSGAEQYFSRGLYDYNSVRFIQMEDGFVKVGIRKPGANIGGDWLCFTNFRMIFEMAAGEGVELLQYQEDVQNLYTKLLGYEDEVGGGLLYSLINDARMEFDGEYSDFEQMSKEECIEAIAALEELLGKVEKTIESNKNLKSVFNSMNALYNSTDYAGKEAFGTVLNKANNYLDENYEIAEDDDFDSFASLYNDLLAARIEYLKSQEPVNGAYDFSSVINYPWFCNNEYSPKYNEEKGYYAYADEIEETWVANYGEKSVKEVMNEHPDWLNITSNVSWTADKNAVGEWIFYHNCTSGWMGGIDNVTMQHGFTAVGAWSGDPIGGYQEMRQVVTGLPNGYYAMGAFYINAGNNPHEGQYVYINAGDQPNEETMEKAQFTHKGEHWWWGAGNYPLYRTDDWQDLKTNMIYVEDGKVVIGSRSTWFYAVTGFRLYYYGETPDFAALLKPALDAVKEKINGSETVDGLQFAGDVTAANNILAKIPEPITSQEDYQAALSTIKEAEAYVSAANTAVNNFNNNTLAGFSSLCDQYAESNPEADITMTAQLGALSVGEIETDTYLNAEAAAKDLEAYKNYLSFFQTAKKYYDVADVKALMDEQAKYLTDNYANAAKLAELSAALALPYNKAELAALGTDKASKNNPVEVTTLVINPKYDELSKGWNGEMTVDSLGTVERWNCNSDINQTIYSLPAGTYRVQVQAFYRDHGDAAGAYNNFFYNLDEETGEWANPNAKLYANTEETSIVSIASESFYTRSYTQYVDGWRKAEEADAEGNEVWEPHWVYQFKNEVTDSETGEVSYEELDEETVSNGYPWDTKVEDCDDIYFFPSSLRGASCVLNNNPNAYVNTIDVYVEDGASLTFGIRKSTLIGSDWIVMDNWKLFYLGAEAPEAISSVNGANAAKSIYSAAGIRQNSLKKGINIVKSANGQTSKVLVK